MSLYVVCVRACVSAFGRKSVRECVCVRARVCVRVYVCVCVRVIMHVCKNTQIYCIKQIEHTNTLSVSPFLPLTLSLSLSLSRRRSLPPSLPHTPVPAVWENNTSESCRHQRSAAQVNAFS